MYRVRAIAYGNGTFAKRVPATEARRGWSCMTDEERDRAFKTGDLPKIKHWRPR